MDKKGRGKKFVVPVCWEEDDCKLDSGRCRLVGERGGGRLLEQFYIFVLAVSFVYVRKQWNKRNSRGKNGNHFCYTASKKEDTKLVLFFVY